MRAGKVMVVFAHGKGFALVWQATRSVVDFMTDAGAPSNGGEFDLVELGIDCAAPSDGVWIFDLDVVDAGTGDWPGSREAMPQLTNPRAATAEEWAHHRAGEWPWEPLPKEES